MYLVRTRKVSKYLASIFLVGAIPISLLLHRVCRCFFFSSSAVNPLSPWKLIPNEHALFQAFLIAFTSEFLPRQLYQYQYNDQLHGYVNFTLAWAPVNATKQSCRYQSFRDPQGRHTLFYWKLLAARLAFVIVFEVSDLRCCSLQKEEYFGCS